MPAQASADTPELLPIDCSSGGVGGPSLGKLLIDIVAYAGNVRLSLRNGDPHPQNGMRQWSQRSGYERPRQRRSMPSRAQPNSCRMQ
ncbi:hypothetical protein HaLaN_17733 [Haematococcus lacustris]|uniref:Uncharacterized protein n=1 Tax=Haematococcus lacustris TaxID=44745 RepID=A0A699ZD26_HAELA|nr:hypothetical protein HaLaN_17733 [Haematococcus lacustris]